MASKDDSRNSAQSARSEFSSESLRPTQSLFVDPAIQRIVSAYLRLAEEVWVLTERVAVLQAIEARRGMSGTFDTFQFTSNEDSAVANMRTAFIRRILEPMTKIEEAGSAAASPVKTLAD